MLIQFFKENIVCDFFLALALLSWFITIGARIESKKTGHFVSGVPAVGGICVIIGFLLSSAKWFALLGLLDPDLMYLALTVIPDYWQWKKDIRNYIPPDEINGDKVIEYSSYNQCYEEILFPMEYPNAFELHNINRYVIISRDNNFVLLKFEQKDKLIESSEPGTLDACKRQASKKAKWIKK